MNLDYQLLIWTLLIVDFNYVSSEFNCYLLSKEKINSMNSQKCTML